MAAHHPNQNASSFRRIPSPGGHHAARTRSPTSPSPPSLPIFSSEHATTSNSTLSSKSSGSNNGGPSTNTSIKVGQYHHPRRNKQLLLEKDMHNRALSRKALMENDAMVYLDGPQVYTCGNCRTHLTSHDDIISKSFHGRRGRAYLFDQCVNVTTGPAEDRFLITGLHSVSDIFCKRCETLIGWTYAKAYEPSQKYKEGKFIIEKINLHLEESDYYTVDRPAGERGDKWRVRSMSWGSERSLSVGSYGEAMGSPSGVMGSPGAPSYHHPRGRCGSGSNSSIGGNNSYHNRAAPQTPTRRSPGMAMMSPKSPRSPSDIIYEYPRAESES